MEEEEVEGWMDGRRKERRKKERRKKVEGGGMEEEKMKQEEGMREISLEEWVEGGMRDKNL